MKTTLIDSMATDARVVQAARVSTQGSESLNSAADKGLINYLMREKHASPFEHGSFTWYIEAPIFVAREFMRHRSGSYNETSGRYKILDTKFYYPLERPMIQTGKASEYVFEQGEELRQDALEQFDNAYGTAEEAYNNLLEAGVAKEVARMVLPVGLYTSWYVTMNPRATLNFLSLRTAPNALWEIQRIAESMENDFATTMPLTHQAWVTNGRSQL